MKVSSSFDKGKNKCDSRFVDMSNVGKIKNTNDSIIMSQNIKGNCLIYYKPIITKDLSNSLIIGSRNILLRQSSDLKVDEKLSFSNIKVNNKNIIPKTRNKIAIKPYVKSLNKSSSYYNNMKTNLQKSFDKSINNIKSSLNIYAYNKIPIPQINYSNTNSKPIYQIENKINLSINPPKNDHKNMTIYTKKHTKTLTPNLSISYNTNINNINNNTTTPSHVSSYEKLVTISLPNDYHSPIKPPINKHYCHTTSNSNNVTLHKKNHSYNLDDFKPVEKIIHFNKPISAILNNKNKKNRPNNLTISTDIINDEIISNLNDGNCLFNNKKMVDTGVGDYDINNIEGLKTDNYDDVKKNKGKKIKNNHDVYYGDPNFFNKSHVGKEKNNDKNKKRKLIVKNNCDCGQGGGNILKNYKTNFLLNLGSDYKNIQNRLKITIFNGNIPENVNINKIVNNNYTSSNYDNCKGNSIFLTKHSKIYNKLNSSN